MDVLFWEDNILKVIKHKPTNKRSFNRKNYYRETDPILSKVRDSYYPISIKIGEKYVSKDLYFSSKIKYTFHCSAGGYHRTGWKAEVHSKTVKTDVYCSYSPVEFLEKSILDLENSYMSVCSKVEQNEVKRRITLYKHKLKVMGV